MSALRRCYSPRRAVRAQDPGPQAPPPTFKVERIPAEPHPGPPPLPVEEIIHRFAANEDVMKKAYDTYDFTQSIRLDELSDPGGKFSVTAETYVKADGLRYMRVTKPAESSLKLMHFSLEDVRVIASMPEFPLTSGGDRELQLQICGAGKAGPAEHLYFPGEAEDLEPQETIL